MNTNGYDGTPVQSGDRIDLHHPDGYTTASNNAAEFAYGRPLEVAPERPRTPEEAARDYIKQVTELVSGMREHETATDLRNEVV